MPYHMDWIPGIADVPAGWLDDIYAFLQWRDYFKYYNLNAQKVGVLPILPAYLKEDDE